MEDTLPGVNVMLCLDWPATVILFLGTDKNDEQCCDHNKNIKLGGRKPENF